MRAAWIATVSNIDWPSTNNLTTAQQKAELVGLLDRASQLRLNTIIFQVRPACDALYQSAFEPWSEYLTGTMGQRPEPFYDPLQFIIEQAHKRGLELHAWFNPYRARHAAARSPVANNHISKRRPQLVCRYGKSLWLDPGQKEVQDYSLAVIMDVVRRYDIDGVHLDDYFYPYTERNASGADLDFPDNSSWRRYGAGRGSSREDWRRENVNVFIHRLYDSIKRSKPWVKFGVSPFGIWRPGNPAQIQGYDAYAKLYADSRKWLTSAWVDYFVPQLYWSIESPQQSFPVLLDWWAGQNPRKRLLAPGLDSTKVDRRWTPAEITSQIKIARKVQAGGHVHWSMQALMRSESLDAALLKEVYEEPALVPVMSWLGGKPPAKPSLMTKRTRGGLEAGWTETGREPVKLWILQTRSGGKWKTKFIAGEQRSCILEGQAPEAIALSALGRYGHLSRPAVLER